MQEIKTDRLIFRPLGPDDAAAVSSLAGDCEVARQMARVPHPYVLEAARQWIVEIPDGKDVVFAIESGGRLIGQISHKPDGPGVREIAYWLGRDFWGKGYATEAALAFLPVIFEDGSVETISAGHALDNPGSKNVIEKLGFKLIGDITYYSLARGEDVAGLLYQLRRDEFLQRKVS